MALAVVAATSTVGATVSVRSPQAESEPMRGSSAGKPEATLHGLVIEPSPAVKTLSLPDAAAGGTETRFVAAPHGLLLVYFGYTSCPDICPTTLADLGAALRRLGKRASRVEVAMVTVDPERDTGPMLSAYLDHFLSRLSRGYHALRTDDLARLETVARAFGAKYEVLRGPDGRIEVAHSALLYAVDDEGRVLAAWPFGTSTRALTHDLRLLLRRT